MDPNGHYVRRQVDVSGAYTFINHVSDLNQCALSVLLLQNIPPHALCLPCAPFDFFE